MATVEAGNEAEEKLYDLNKEMWLREAARDRSGQEEVFELNEDGTKRLYVVKKSETSKETDNERLLQTSEYAQSDYGLRANPMVVMEERPGPMGVRSVVHKGRDDHLEINIPPLGCSSGFAIFLTGFTIVWFSFLGVWCCGVTISAIATLNPIPLMMLLFSVPFWIAGLFLLRTVIQVAFVHENVSITPTQFHITRKVMTKESRRNSAIPGERATLSRWDRLVAKQAAGRTADLIRAEIKTTIGKHGSQSKSLVMWEGVKEHELSYGLNEPEMEWLMTEINAVIQSGRQSLIDL